MSHISPYHPLRHRFVVGKYKAMKERLEIETKAMIRRNASAGMTMQQNHAAIMAHTMATHYAGLSPDNIASREKLSSDVHSLYLNWLHSGKAVFDCSHLAPLFARTDVADAPFQDIKLPFEFFYVHFGRESDLFLDDGRFIEGCYVGHHQQSATDPEALLVAFLANYRDIENREKHTLGFTLCETSAVMRCMYPYGDIVGARSRDHDMVDGAPEITENAQLVAKATNALVNFLFYISMKDAEVEPGYPADAPARLVGLAPTKPKARRQLETLGYVKVNMVGRCLAAAQASPCSERAGVAPHWRRGHWHHVRTGPGRQNLERRWFMPTQIHASSPINRPPHVYDLKEPS